LIVIDASALAAALADDGAVGVAARDELEKDLHWAAPAHVRLEVVSAVRGLVLGGKLAARRGSDAVRLLGELEIDTVDPAALVRRVWQLRHNVTAYDAAYLGAAEALQCALVTGDARLQGVPGTRCAVTVIGET